jgi:hypothetical protein
MTETAGKQELMENRNPERFSERRKHPMFEEKNWDPVFADRMAVHYDELKWLYAELYHNDQQAFDYFCSMHTRRFSF